jgi:hypothetical protein
MNTIPKSSFEIAFSTGPCCKYFGKLGYCGNMNEISEDQEVVFYRAGCLIALHIGVGRISRHAFRLEMHSAPM